MSITYTKTSARTIKSGCKKCGAKDVYWFRNEDTRKYVMVDRTPFTATPTMPKDATVDVPADGLDGFEIHACHVERDAEKSDDTSKRESEQDNSTDYRPDYCTGCGALGNLTDGKCETCAVKASESNGETMSTATATATTTDATDPRLAMLDALTGMLSPTVDVETVERIVKEQLDAIVFPTRTVCERATGVKVEIDNSHAILSDVLLDVLAGEHVMLVGPAGTGKSTLGEQVAEATGLPFFSMSCHTQMSDVSFFGFMNANGEYVSTDFRKAFEHGGIFLLDEMDNGNSEILAALNSALSNSQVGFPDGPVKRHDDFRVIASANTFGRGADPVFVGRQSIDVATLDRFTVEYVDYDETLEKSLCLATGADGQTVERVLKLVRKLREDSSVKRMRLTFSPRASVRMCRLVAAGKSWDKSRESAVLKGMSEQDRRALDV